MSLVLLAFSLIEMMVEKRNHKRAHQKHNLCADVFEMLHLSIKMHETWQNKLQSEYHCNDLYLIFICLSVCVCVSLSLLSRQCVWLPLSRIAFCKYEMWKRFLGAAYLHHHTNVICASFCHDKN